MIPKVLGEEETLDLALSGRSIARVGEGELRVALGTKCISQRADPRLRDEMRRVLALEPGHPCLPCIPRFRKGMPNEPWWSRFVRPPFTGMYHKRQYGSAFITRPDVADIDRPEYWQRLRGLWRGKDVTLVIGTVRSLTEAMLVEASSVRVIWGKRRDAYDEIDRIEEEIGKPAGPVILCLGCAATVLAVRLANRGLFGLDLGHAGFFMPHEGIFSMQQTDMISPEYLVLQKELHASPEGYGGSSHKQAAAVIEFVAKTKAELILDYGCGQGRLQCEMLKQGCTAKVHEYDPAIKGKERLPKPADMVVCTDVLEHIEPDKLGYVLAHIWNLAKVGAYLVIATRPAGRTLSDGRNAHLILKSRKWWVEQLVRSGWHADRMRIEEKPGHHITLWLTKEKLAQ